MRSDTETDPSDIPGTGRWAVLKRTALEFKEDNLTDWAAALTYYAVLALFPALLALVALVGIFGQYPQTTNALIDVARQVSGGNSALTGLQNTDQRRRAEQGRRRRAARPRPRRRAVVGLGLHRRLHARVQRDLRGGRGPPVLEAAPAAGRGHAGDGAAHGARAHRARGQRPAGQGRGLHDRAGLGRGDRLSDRQVADHGRGRARVARTALLRGPQRQAPAHPVAEPGRGRGARDLGRRLRGVRLLRGALRLLQQDLRHARRRDLAARVAVDLQPRRPLRPGAQRRDRARAPAHRRAAGRARPAARAARCPQGSRGQGHRGLALRPLPPRRRGRGTPHARGSASPWRAIRSSCSRVH